MYILMYVYLHDVGILYIYIYIHIYELVMRNYALKDTNFCILLVDYGATSDNGGTSDDCCWIGLDRFFNFIYHVMVTKMDRYCYNKQMTNEESTNKKKIKCIYLLLILLFNYLFYYIKNV